MARLKLSSPWEIFYKEVQAMFREDPCVHVVFDEENCVIKMYVEDGMKADALAQIMVRKKTFGNITVMVDIIPSNLITDFPDDDAILYSKAFERNGAVSYIKSVKGIFSNDLIYVVFRNTVVQYFNDNLGDANGLCSTLYQEIAKDIFDISEGVFYCTDVPEGGAVGLPLGEWP